MIKKIMERIFYPTETYVKVAFRINIGVAFVNTVGILPVAIATHSPELASLALMCTAISTSLLGLSFWANGAKTRK